MNVLVYFILWMVYFINCGVDEYKLNPEGIIVFNFLFYSSFVVIPGSLVYFAVTRKIDYKREWNYIISAILLTIILFEFVFRNN